MNCMNYQLGSLLLAPKRLLVLTLLLRTIHNVNAAIFNINTPRHQKQHLLAIEQLKQLIPPPRRHELGGEEADDAAYARFLSVTDWDPIKAAPKLKKSIEWRKRIRPGMLRPHHCSTLSRQHAWVALMAGSKIMSLEDANNNKNNNNNGERLPLDPPHYCPPLQSWRTTRHGLPITYFRCWMWKPNEASSEEMECHMAYHMHHLIRRMQRNVSRICIIFDMRGFESWMLPYIHQVLLLILGE